MVYHDKCFPGFQLSFSLGRGAGALGTGFAIRAVVFDTTVVSSVEVRVEASGLEKWLGGGGGGELRVRHRLVVADKPRLLVQVVPERFPRPIYLPAGLAVEAAGPRLCRYHEGPRGEPEKHWYCTSLAVTGNGFCRKHSSSPLALYWRCTSSDDEACRRIDELWGDEEYVVYAIDYGGERLKIGLTRKWRFMWRIAEQPHVSAAIIASSNSIVEARSYERRMGRKAGASEGIGLRVSQRLLASTSLLKSLSQERIARRLAEMLHRLGVRGEVEAYTIMPAKSPQAYVAHRVLSGPEDLMGLDGLVFEDYWAGMLYARREGGEPVLVEKKKIQHIVLRGSIRSE